jgi:hypothetical protein
MTDPKDHDEDQDELDEDEDEDESPPPPKAKAKPKASVAKPSAASSKAVKAPALTSSHLIGIGIAALLVGGAAGWFGHIQKGKADLRAAVAAAPAGSGVPAGPCGAWQTKLCKSTGEQSAACQQAKAATGVLSTPACESAISTLPETLAKIKAARASCDKLVDKLCADLPPGSKTCAMVKDRTPSFPAERCAQMMGQYDKVIAELRQMDQQQGAGGPPMGGAPMGAPGGMRLPGMPGGMPHDQVPQPASHP